MNLRHPYIVTPDDVDAALFRQELVQIKHESQVRADTLAQELKRHEKRDRFWEAALQIAIGFVLGVPIAIGLFRVCR